MCEFWNKKHEKLSKEAVTAVLNLFEHMGSKAKACKIPIPGTTPKTFIIVGEMKDIKRLTNE